MEQVGHHQDLMKFQHYHQYNAIIFLQVGPHVIGLTVVPLMLVRLSFSTLVFW